MISYKPLWELMDAKDMTTYTLRNMGKEYCLSGWEYPKDCVNL